MRTLLGVIASGLMLGVYVRGEWAYLLGFVALVPWARETSEALPIWP